MQEIRGKQRKLFTKQEAEQAGLDWKDWRDPTVKKDSYIISDDDFVAQVKAIYNVKNSRGYINRILRTIGGQVSQDFAKEFKLYDKYMSRNNMGNPLRQGNRKPSWREKRIADLFLEGYPIQDACSLVFPKRNSRKLSKLITKRKSFIEYLSMKAKDAFKSAGVDEHYLAKEFKTLAETAESEQVRFQTLQYISKLIQLENTQQKTDEKWLHAELENEDLEELEAGQRTVTEGQDANNEGEIESVPTEDEV